MLLFVAVAFAQITPPEDVRFTLDWSCSMLQETSTPPTLVRGQVTKATRLDNGACRHNARVDGARRGDSSVDGISSLQWTAPCGPSVGDRVHVALSAGQPSTRHGVMHVAASHAIPWAELVGWLASRETTRGPVLVVRARKGALDAR